MEVDMPSLGRHQHSPTAAIGDEDEYSRAASTFAGLHATAEVLGPGGIVTAYEAICGERIESLIASGVEEDDSELEKWMLEALTWRLVNRLYEIRTLESESESLVHAFSSVAALERQYVGVRENSENQAVLNWLAESSTLPDVDDKDISANGWVLTREAVERGKAMHLGRSQSLATELDPDGPLRQQKSIDPQDEARDRLLCRTLFRYVLCGDLDAACDLCRQYGQFWRAASLQGCLEFRDSEIDGVDVDQGIIGTKRKALWRRACYRLSQQSMLDEYERALYGALCGDISSVLPVCETWQDQLWAYFNALVQARVEKYFESIGCKDLPKDLTMPEYSYLTRTAIFESLMNSEDGEIWRASRLPFRVIQARIITDQVDQLLYETAEQLRGIGSDANMPVTSSPHILRFVTHFILTLRQLDALPSTSNNNAATILQAYVELLGANGKSDLVPLYSAQLPRDVCLEVYARFLRDIDSAHEREHQYRLAQRHGLPVDECVVRAVDMVLDEELPATGRSSSLHVGRIADDLSAVSDKLISAISWLPLMKAAKDVTAPRLNLLYRAFYSLGDIAAAYTLTRRIHVSDMVTDEALAAIAMESASSDEVLQAMHELAMHEQLCMCLMQLEACESDSETAPAAKAADPIGQQQQSAERRQQYLATVARVRLTLDGDLYNPERIGLEDGGQDVVAFDTLLRLRTVYVSELAIRLHKLHFSRSMYNACLAQAVQVADERVRVYASLEQSGRLHEYLHLIGQAGVRV